MICFEGPFSKDTRNYMRNKLAKISLPIALFILILGTIPICLYYHIVTLIIFVAALGVAIFCVCFPFIALTESIPKKIEIEDGYIEYYLENKSFVKNIENIKKIKDLGNFYDMVFYFPHKSVHCIFQKNLISQGTIEEFENLFKSKIVKK